MRKPAFCICENKGADQLRDNREADQCLCFCYRNSTIPLLPKSEISSVQPSSVVVQPDLCGTWSETRRPVFSQRGSYCSVTSQTKFKFGSFYQTLAPCQNSRSLLILMKLKGDIQWIRIWLIWVNVSYDMSRDVRKPDFCICENKGADQFRN